MSFIGDEHRRRVERFNQSLIGWGKKEAKLRAEITKLEAFRDTAPHNGFEDWWSTKSTGSASIKELAELAFIAGRNSVEVRGE